MDRKGMGMGTNYRLYTLALALAACNSGGGGTDPTDSGTGPTVTATDTLATSGPTDGSADSTATDSAVEGSDSLTGSTNTPSDPTEEPTTTPSPSTPSDPGTDTTASTTSPISGTTDTTDDPPPANCGDGKIDGGEECDDGPENGPFGNCYEDCTLNVCGDGNVGPLESCDLGPDNGPDNGCSTECAVLPSACGNQAVMAELVPSPVDIIIIIDNSGSMSAEIKGVQDNININFAAILEEQSLDYRVVVVAKHGKLADESVCIEAPLSGIAQGGCVTPPSKPINNPGKFYHYSREIASADSWCRALRTVVGAEKDDHNLAPTGWQEWLRPESFKTFIELTDDRVNCSGNGVNFNDSNTSNNPNLNNAEALEFDTALRNLLPLHFGATPEARNYRWYSIVGMAYNNPQDKPYGPMDPLVTGKCPEGVNAGQGYQALSNLTGGLRFPLCNTASYGPVFQAIADGVIDSAKLGCEFDIPAAPEGKVLDKETVSVLFTPMGMGNPTNFMKVENQAACVDGAFYLEGEKVILCPATCDSIQGDKDAALSVEFTCEPLAPN